MKNLIVCLRLLFLLLQGMFDGNMEAHLRRLVDEGLRLLLPSENPSQPRRGRVPAAIPTAAREPLNTLLAAAQRLAPTLRPNAAELADGLEAVGHAVGGNNAAYTAFWARRQALEEERLADVLVEFYNKHNLAKVPTSRDIAKCYSDRQVYVV
jgi:hypothetical protein